MPAKTEKNKPVRVKELKALAGVNKRWLNDAEEDRTKKEIERLTYSHPRARVIKKVVVVKGKGEKLRDIPHVAAHINKSTLSDDTMLVVFRLCYQGNPKDFSEHKHALEKFSGVVYNDDRKFTRNTLEKQLADYKLTVLRNIADFLCINRNDLSRDELIESIADFLEKPKETDYVPNKRPHSSKARSKSPPKKRAKKSGLKKPRSAYMLFFKANYAELAAKHKDEKVTEIASRMGKLWHTADKEEKAKYEKLAKKEKKAYQEKKEELEKKEKKDKKAKKEKKDRKKKKESEESSSESEKEEKEEKEKEVEESA